MEFSYDVSTKHHTKNAVSFIDYHRDKIPALNYNSNDTFFFDNILSKTSN